MDSIFTRWSGTCFSLLHASLIIKFRSTGAETSCLLFYFVFCMHHSLLVVCRYIKALFKEHFEEQPKGGNCGKDYSLISRKKMPRHWFIFAYQTEVYYYLIIF